MAFSDPQSVTINAVPFSLPRINTGNAEGHFTSADGNTRLEVAPKTGNRRVSTVRLYQNKLIADPLVGTVNVRVGDMWSITLNRPKDGYSDQECLDQLTGLIAWLTASTNANAKKFIAGEN